jgi:hypothetical protein
MKGSIKHTHTPYNNLCRQAAKKESPLAPAISSSFFPHLLAPESEEGWETKMALLRCFQIIQDPKMMRESRSFLTRPFTVSETISHQSIKETVSGCGAKLCSPNFLSKLYQKTLKKTQLMSKWFRVSPCWSHKGHLVG